MIVHASVGNEVVAEHQPELRIAQPMNSQVGIAVVEGRIFLGFCDHNGQRATLDLTAAIEEIAERKVQEHMAKWHGHQI